MFSCCLWTTRGSDLKKDKSEGHGGAWRYLVLSCLQCFWPFGQRETDLTQDSQAQDHADKGVHECAPEDMKKPCGESYVSADMVERMVNHLVPSLQGRDAFFVSAFLYTYRSFTTTLHVLDLLLRRYAHFRRKCEEDEQVKRIFCSFLNSWIDIYPEEFCQTSDLSVLKKLEAYLTVNMPDSDLNRRVQMLLTELQLRETERKDEGDSRLENHVAGDPESNMRFLSVKQQPEPAGARDRESKVHRDALMLEPDVTSAIHPAHLLAAMERVTHQVSGHSGLSNISPSG
ncbi:ral guanine nucleotide dissociation stimulator-like 1 [Apodemus sylvaticus]|uniref:ral guanine nucleotide dissociation stimulator-like 1 n=1 Tax=Apodemus sylvaticus TaxID=10129 RepID=UPI0022431E1E|nr:ral guanine nucleotide dissociation stimulator-like 1 [Apodemus sylvaticus]